MAKGKNRGNSGKRNKMALTPSEKVKAIKTRREAQRQQEQSVVDKTDYALQNQQRG
jgi:hypothetical protein